MSNFSPFPTAFDNIFPESFDNLWNRAAKLELRVSALEPGVKTFNARSGDVVLQLGDLTPLTDSRYVLKAGDTMLGGLAINASAATGLIINTSGAALITSAYIETGFQFSHYQDALINVAPVVAEFYHDSTAGTPAVGNGAAIDFSADSNTTDRQTLARMTASWTVATHATRTSQLRFFVENSGSLVQALQFSATTFGAFGTGAVTQQVSGANVTNNVTVGGTNDTIADFSDLTTFANSAAAIRNDIYQLARKVKQINDGLRAYGLLT